MQLTEAMQGSGPVLNHGMSIVHPVLPSISIREITTDTLFPAHAGHSNAPPATSRQDSILVTPATMPVLPDIQRPGCGTAPATKSHTVAPAKIIRPRSASVSRRVSKNSPFVEQDIPLYLVPAIIARAIWQRGEQTFRISVIRTKQHYYTIRMRTARPGTRATKPCGKSRCGNKSKKNPGKIPSQPSSKPVELQNP